MTPRQIISQVAAAADELHLPHSVHIHCNNLGMPGNWQTTLETMKALEGRRGHLTHIQFHSYGGGEGDENTFNSKVAPLAEYVNSHENVTIDVGQVLFGSPRRELVVETARKVSVSLWDIDDGSIGDGVEIIC